MTPSKRGNMTCIRIEKVKKAHIDESQVAHKAGGQHQGLVVNRQAAGTYPELGEFIPVLFEHRF